MPATAAVCPHCALLCDDLDVSLNADLGVSVARNGCRRAKQLLAQAPPAPFTAVAGTPCNMGSALDHAAKLLKRAKQPLFGGLASDVDGTRQAIALAERCGATLDHLHGDTQALSARLLQSRGWYATTLSETRNRADLIVILGADLNHNYENFFRRVAHRAARLKAPGGQQRQVAYLGAAANKPAQARVDFDLRVGTAKLNETLLQLLAALASNQPAPPRLAPLLEAIQNAHYCVFVVAPSDLGSAAGATLATTLDLIDQLNKQQRAALLTLGGNQGGQSATSTAAWLTGYPLRTTHGKRTIYAPESNATHQRLANNSVDLLLWIDAYGEHPKPPVCAAPVIVLSASPPAASGENSVFFQVGTPGVDHFARLVRTDGVITLAAPQLRQSGLPSVATVLAQLAERM